MSYPTTLLITDAYYLSGIVSREFQTVSGSQVTDGLRLLNAFLAVKTANTKLIPYYQEYDFVVTALQEKYFIQNLVGIETVTFTLGIDEDVRFPVYPSSRRQYFGTPRANNVNSILANYRAERTVGGMNLYFYFKPQAAYPVKIMGKFGLMSVSLTDNLEDFYDAFYIEYLRHGLAQYIASDNSTILQPQAATRLKELEEILLQISPPDLSVSKFSSLKGSGGLNWGDVNIGHLWRPGS